MNKFTSKNEQKFLNFIQGFKLKLNKNTNTSTCIDEIIKHYKHVIYIHTKMNLIYFKEIPREFCDEFN